MLWWEDEDTPHGGLCTRCEKQVDDVSELKGLTAQHGKSRDDNRSTFKVVQHLKPFDCLILRVWVFGRYGRVIANRVVYV